MIVRFHACRGEAVDLAAATAILLVAFAPMSLRHVGHSLNVVHALLVITTPVLLGFLLHELAHRQTARMLGYYACFRAWRLGLLITLISGIASLFIPIVFAAPGAVYVIPRAYHIVMHPARLRRDEMLISSAGPMTNIALSIVGSAGRLVTTGSTNLFLTVLAHVNAFLAFFNLLPIPMLDGYKIFRASIFAWAPMFLASVVLLAASHIAL